MKNIYRFFCSGFFLCLFVHVSAQTPSLQLTSAITVSPVSIHTGSEITVTASIKNTGSSGTFDFECDLVTTSGGYVDVIKKTCNISINAGATKVVTFTGTVDHSANSYKLSVIGLFSSCFQCGNSGCASTTVAPNGNQNPLPITVLGPYCSGTTNLTASSGSFDDGSGSDNYGNNQSCSWLIQPTGASSVTLSFSSFSTESGFDYVKIYNGTNASGTLLASYSGSSIPANVTSGSSMFVQFTSDGATVKPGWAASYTSSASCSAPNSQANGLSFSSVSSSQVTLNWSNGNGANRIVVVKAGSAISGTPSDGTSFSANTSFGSGSSLNSGEYVVYNGTGSNVTVTGLSASTIYYYRVFEYNCSPAKYLTSTSTGNPSSQQTSFPSSCTAPTSQSNTISFSGVTTTQTTLTWTNGNGTGRIVVAKAGSAVTGTPADGSSYSQSATFGSGSTLNSGEYIVYNGTGSTVTVTGLTAGTAYYYRIFDYNCSPTKFLSSTTGGNPSNQTTSSSSSCTTPTTQANTINFSGVSTTQTIVNWTNGNGTNRIVVAKAGSAVSGTPSNGTNYAANAAFGSGSSLNTGEYVVYNGSGTTITVTGLSPGTTYYYRVFESACSPAQFLTSSATGNPSSQQTSTSSCAAPSIQASGLTFTSVAATQTTINWTNGNGSNRIVIAKAGSAISGTPTNGTTDNGDPSYGAGSVLNSGEYVVYNGTGSSVTVTNLTPGTTYFYRVYEFSCGPPQYSTATGTGNPASIATLSGPSISIVSFDIPKWAREKDAFNGSVTVSTSNPSSGTWHLRVKVFNSSTNIQLTSFDYDPQTGPSRTFFSDDPQIKLNSVAGRQLRFYAILNANNDGPLVGSMNIIEKKWDGKNTVFYNSGSNQLFIPLKYFSNTISTTISFSRVTGTSNSEETLTNVPTVQFGNDSYFVLNNTNSLIKTVKPGPFYYTIKYNPSDFYEESGSFDLTKIGNVHNMNVTSNQIVVLVGGIRNEIETDVSSLSSTYDPQSSSAWSIANDLSLGNGRNTWYIAQGNMNATQKNAFNLGVALEEIRRICVNDYHIVNPQMSVIAHSKGGLEMRLMLDGKGSPMSNSENFTLNPANPFTNITINNSLQSLVFLGTPHRGSNFGYAIKNTPGGSDLLPNSQLMQYLNLSGYPQIPNIRIANITGYQIGAPGNAYLDVNGDGLVTVESSSEGININGASLFRQYYVAKEFNPYSLENYLDYVLREPNFVEYFGYFNSMANFIIYLSYHSQLHKSYVLNDASNSCATYLNKSSPGILLCRLTITPGTSSTLSKILSVIDNNSIADNCSDPNYISCVSSAQTFASLLSNATISKYYDDTYKKILSKSDENGNFQFRLSDSLTIGDKMIIEAPGIESLIFTIDSTSLTSKNLSFPMVKSQVPNESLAYPKIDLLNHSPITSDIFFRIRPTALNIQKIEIITPKDSVFRTLIEEDTSRGILLDTGLNTILIRFIGKVDTIILSKSIYYFPGILLDSNTYNISVSSDERSIGSKLYVNDIFYQRIDSFKSTIRVLKGHNKLKFSHFGYKDALIDFDSLGSVQLSAILTPVSFSSKLDSSQIDFIADGKNQYRKNITLNENLRKGIVSIKQYDDSLLNRGLIIKSRKFEIKHLNSGQLSIKFASILDQIENLSQDSIYLMRIYDDTSFSKLPFDVNGVLAGYDSSVQKLTYNDVNFNYGTAVKESLVIIKKKAPIVNSFAEFKVNENDTLKIPLSKFFADPDSIKNDMGIIVSSYSSELNSKIVGDTMIMIPTPCWNGSGSFNLDATHDGLTRGIAASVEVLATPLPGVTNSGATVFCQGRNVVLKADTGVSYLWSNNLTTQTITVSQSGVYTVAVKDKYGCIRISKPDTVTVLPLPVVNAGANQNVCFGNSVFIGSTAIAGNIYLWSPVNGLNNPIASNPAASPQATTTYKLTVTASNGCVDSAKTTVTVLPLPVTNAGPNNTICLNDRVLIGAPPIAGYSYQWRPFSSLDNPNVSNPTTNPGQTTNYTLLVTKQNTGCVDSAKTTVFVNPLPVNDLLANQVVCIGSGLKIGITNVSTNNYLWTPATSLSSTTVSNPDANPQTSINYTLQVTNQFNCVVTKQTTIKVNPLPTVNAGSQVAIRQGAPTIIGSSPSAAGNPPFTYRWTPSSALNSSSIGNPLATPVKTIVYHLEVTDGNSCKNTDTIKVFVIPGDYAFTVYPNPTKDMVTVVGANIENGIWDVDLINPAGRPAAKSQLVTVVNNTFYFQTNVSSLASGIYIIFIKKGNLKYALRVQK